MPRRASMPIRKSRAAGCTRSAIVYRVRIIGGELRDEVDGSTDTCAWFTPGDAARLHLGDLARRMLAVAVADAARGSGASGA